MSKTAYKKISLEREHQIYASHMYILLTELSPEPDQFITWTLKINQSMKLEKLVTM